MSQNNPKIGPVTANQVAALAGVSRAAVSRSFTPGASVSGETRRKVLEAADKLGYQVNHLARGLISSQSGLVALIATEVETPYRAKLLSHLAQGLQKIGKTPLLIVTDHSDESSKAALQRAINYRTEAAIVLSGKPDAAFSEMCLNNGISLVLINREEDREGALQIRLDDHEAGATAFHLLYRTGCKRIALIASSAATPSLVGRVNGFKEAAKSHGMDITLSMSGKMSYATGLQVGTELFSGANVPDGVFCVSDLLACGVIDAARTRFGLNLASELSVIGFDDIDQAGWESYNLTTFAQPINEIVTAATDWIANSAHKSPETRTLPAKLVWRRSVRPARNLQTSSGAYVL